MALPRSPNRLPPVVPSGVGRRRAGENKENVPALPAYTALFDQLRKARKAEAAGNDPKAVRELCTFLALATDSARVPDADVRTVLDRDTRAVIDSIEGAATLPGVEGTRR